MGLDTNTLVEAIKYILYIIFGGVGIYTGFRIALNKLQLQMANTDEKFKVINEKFKSIEGRMDEQKHESDKNRSDMKKEIMENINDLRKVFDESTKERNKEFAEIKTEMSNNKVILTEIRTRMEYLGSAPKRRNA